MNPTAVPPLARMDPHARAVVRLQADHVSRALVSALYRFRAEREISVKVPVCGVRVEN